MLKIVLATLGASGLLVFSAVAPPSPRLVWNASESVPVGLYAIGAAAELKVSDLILVQPSERLASFLADGGYLPRGAPLLKRIAALPGQKVCRNGLEITVEGATWAMARERDRAGRLLPVWNGCRVVAAGELFLLNRDEPASLDGRYFGPIPASTIVGRASPLWLRTEG